MPSDRPLDLLQLRRTLTTTLHLALQTMFLPSRPPPLLVLPLRSAVPGRVHTLKNPPPSLPWMRRSRNSAPTLDLVLRNSPQRSHSQHLELPLSLLSLLSLPSLPSLSNPLNPLTLLCHILRHHIFHSAPCIPTVPEMETDHPHPVFLNITRVRNSVWRMIWLGFWVAMMSSLRNC